MKTSSRRGFIKNGVLFTLLGPTCLTLGAEELLAQNKSGDKIPFEQESINKLFADPVGNKKLALEIERDFKGFIRAHFALSDSQLQRLNRFSERYIDELTKLFEPISKYGGKVHVQLKEVREKQVKGINNFTARASGRSYKVDVEYKSKDTHVKAKVEGKD